MYFVKSSRFGYNDVDSDFVVFNLIAGSYSLPRNEISFYKKLFSIKLVLIFNMKILKR